LLREGGGGLNVKDLMLAYICLNAAIAIVEYMAIFNFSIPYTSPMDLKNQFSIPSNWENVIIPSSLAVGGAISLIIGYGTAGIALLMISVLNFFWKPAQIVIGGFGTLLARMGAPPIIEAIANAFSAIIWMFFVIEYLGGRKVE